MATVYSRKSVQRRQRKLIREKLDVNYNGRFAFCYKVGDLATTTATTTTTTTTTTTLATDATFVCLICLLTGSDSVTSKLARLSTT